MVVQIVTPEGARRFIPLQPALFRECIRFWRTETTSFLPYQIFIAMRNISPKDVEVSPDGQSIQAAMVEDLQHQPFNNSMHGDFTCLAQLLGKEITLPLPDGIPARSNQGIFYDNSVLGELKCIKSVDSNPYAVRDGVWEIQAYMSGCRGVSHYIAPLQDLREWLCNTVARDGLMSYESLRVSNLSQEV